MDEEGRDPRERAERIEASFETSVADLGSTIDELATELLTLNVQRSKFEEAIADLP